MVLDLRLAVRSECIVNTAFGGIEVFEKYLNEHPAWMYMQKDAKEWVNGKAIAYPPSMILVSGNIKAILSLPLPEGRNASYNRVITIKNTRRDDRVDALAGTEVKEPIQVEGNRWNGTSPPPITKPTEPSKPATPSVAAPAATVTTAPAEASSTRKPVHDGESQGENDHQGFMIAPICPKCRTNLVPERGIYCQTCGHQLPRELAVHREVVVSIKIENYKRLAKYLIHKINRALGGLMMGRKLERVITSMGQRILLVTVQDEMRTSTVLKEEILNDLLVETGSGRLSSDIYEVRQAHEMADSEDSMPLP
jgi:uncharacterized Zn finger protein (UPF0148 family)